MIKLLSVLIVLFGLFLIPASAFAATLVTGSTIDTYISQSAPGASYNNGDMLFISNNAFNQQDRILLKFDISAIPANSVINSAKVELYQQGGEGLSPAQIDLARVTSDWDGSVTWNNRPAIAAPDTVINGDKAFGLRQWNMRDVIKSWVSGSRNYGVEIYYSDFAPRAVMSRTYTSASTGNVARRPTLTVDYTPPAFNPIGAGLPVFKPSFSPIQPIDVDFGGAPANLKIRDIKTENITQNGATIKWSTNKNSSTWVFYGNASDGSDRFDLQTGKDELVLNHSVNLANLQSGSKYSFKIMSKDASNKQAFGVISYVTTAQGNVSPTPTPTPASQNPLSKIKDKIENKVADYTISNSIEDGNAAGQASGSGSTVSDAAVIQGENSNPFVVVAGQVGISKLAGILLIILGLMLLIGTLILYKISRKIHHHLRKRLDPKYAREAAKNKK